MSSVVMLSTLSPLLHFNILTAQQLLVAGPLHSNCSICGPPSDAARDRAETNRHPPGEETASALSSHSQTPVCIFK